MKNNYYHFVETEKRKGINLEHISKWEESENGKYLRIWLIGGEFITASGEDMIFILEYLTTGDEK